MKVAVAIPAKNEQRAIGSVVLLAKKYADRVLVVDDGSTDKTSLIAYLSGAEVTRHKANKGKGAAIVTALKWAILEKVDVIVFLDGDGQHDPAAIPDLVKPIKKGEAEITIGSRWLQNGGLKEMPLHRMLGNWVLSTATSLSLSKTIKDSQSGYRAFSSKTFPAFMESMEDGFAVESEMITLADKAGFKWTEVGISAKYKDLDANTESAWYHGLSVLGRAMKILRIQKPARFFGVFSFLSFIMMMLFSFLGITVKAFEGSLVIWYLVAFFIIIGGFFMFSAIMLSGMNRISKRIFQTFMKVYEKK